MKQTRRKRKQLKERAMRREAHEFDLVFRQWNEANPVFIAGGGAIEMEDGSIVYLTVRKR